MSVTLADGLVLFQSRLSAGEQREIWAMCRALAEGTRADVHADGARRAELERRDACLGKHWNGFGLWIRGPADFDGLAVSPVPERFAAVARTAAAVAGFAMQPDLCIKNFYTSAARMGVHQDRDERPETIAAGIPIVAVSLGDDARFAIGGLSRREPTSAVMLKSGDVLVMGGPSRLRYHGVTRVVPGTAPRSPARDGST